MAKDFLSRMGLLDAVFRQIETSPKGGGLGWPVIKETGSAFLRLAEEQGTPAVSIYYAFRLYDQAISRYLDLRHGGYRRVDFLTENDHLIDLGGHPVAWCSDKAQPEKAIDYFLRAQEQLESLPEVKTAGEVYRNAEQATEMVNDYVDRLRLAVTLPPGSLCDGCQE